MLTKYYIFKSHLKSNFKQFCRKYHLDPVMTYAGFVTAIIMALMFGMMSAYVLQLSNLGICAMILSLGLINYGALALIHVISEFSKKHFQPKIQHAHMLAIQRLNK